LREHLTQLGEEDRCGQRTPGDGGESEAREVLRLGGCQPKLGRRPAAGASDGLTHENRADALSLCGGEDSDGEDFSAVGAVVVESRTAHDLLGRVLGDEEIVEMAQDVRRRSQEEGAVRTIGREASGDRRHIVHGGCAHKTGHR
jgi:hypothetical protein